MSNIETQNPNLLTDLDVNSKPFACCGDEDLIFIKCPACQHLMVFCYECDTLYPHLNDLDDRIPLSLTKETDRVICPECNTPFSEFHFLKPLFVDKYLVTRDEVIEKGYEHLLV